MRSVFAFSVSLAASSATLSPQEIASVDPDFFDFHLEDRCIAVLRIAMIYTGRIRGADEQADV